MSRGENKTLFELLPERKRVADTGQGAGAQPAMSHPSYLALGGSWPAAWPTSSAEIAKTPSHVRAGKARSKKFPLPNFTPP